MSKGESSCKSHFLRSVLFLLMAGCGDDSALVDASIQSDAPIADVGAVDAFHEDARVTDGGPASDVFADANTPGDSGPGPDVHDAGTDSGPDAGAVDDDRLILCGEDVVVLEEDRLDEGTGGAVFRWTAEDHMELPDSVRNGLSVTDECKPFAGSLIGVSANSGAVAIFEYPSGQAIFWANVRNAHSVEILPGGLVVVAAANPAARLVLFDIDRPDEMLDETELRAAHGLVWDDEREVLYAAGHDMLRTYTIEDGRRFSSPNTLIIPNQGAHDMRPVPGTDDLVLSTGRNVWFFDRGSEVFRPHPDLGDSSLVKGIDIHPTSGRTVYVRADVSFYSFRFFLLDPDDEVSIRDQRLYKARWSGGLLAR